MNADFLRLSELLTGFDGLSSSLAETYLEFFRAQPGVGSTIDELIDVFSLLEHEDGNLETLVRTRIVENVQFAELTQRIITIWYTASYSKDAHTTVVVEAAPYFQSLLWPTVSAHTPGLSGGYFGYWAYPPEN